MTQRVAAYCRVSTDKEDQLNSFDVQKSFFHDYISRQNNWILAGVYADEGITGTTAKNRAGFLQMIDDAQSGKIDLIVTKEVSRFSRNILDTISYTRTLKTYGVGVVFLNDGISTLEPDSELRLGIMASVAQEESRKTSQRVKWGQQRSMERGVVFGPSLLGYSVKDGNIEIEPSGAQIVQTIFTMYVHENMGARAIARELSHRGIQTSTGKRCWSAAAVLKILKNEKYCGDLVQRKTVTPDYLTHKKKANCDESSLIKIKDHHTPIISKLLWEAAQAEQKRRSSRGAVTAGHGSRYPLSGKISCKNCGAVFTCRTRKKKDGSSYRTWDAGCSGCFGVRIHLSEALLFHCILRIVAKFSDLNIFDVLAGLQDQLEAAQTSQKALLEREISSLETKTVRLADTYISGEISREVYDALQVRYDGALRKLKEKQLSMKKYRTCAVLDDIKQHISDITTGQSADSEFYFNLIENISVSDTNKLTVHLKNLNGNITVYLTE